MPRRPAIILALLLTLSSLTGAAETATPIPGQRTFICGHSFHWYVADLLPTIEQAAGIQGATIAGVQKIGGSRVMQHWELSDDKNQAKRALRAGSVDVLTLSPNVQMPDEGIDRFADLAFTANPQIRVLVQMSWPSWDWKDPTSFRNADRDAVTVEQLETMAAEKGRDYRDRLARQLEAINQRHGRATASLVPAGQAVFILRRLVAKGSVPGISKPSQLFTDDLGHPGEAIRALVGYCHFSVIYRRSPVGLGCFDQGNERRKALQRLLQELAWNAVTTEPLSRVTAAVTP